VTRLQGGRSGNRGSIPGVRRFSSSAYGPDRRSDPQSFLLNGECRGGGESVLSAGFNPITPELNPSAQRCLKKYFTGDFAS
jgi:hypothetical protein